MAINKTVADHLNEQINKELFSAYLYLGIADYFEDRGLAGFAHWYMVQAAEEADHAKIIRRYLHDNEYRPTLAALDKPDASFADDMAALVAALKHEEYVTASIHQIYTAAEGVRDYRSMQLLEWFIAEQGEEETNAHDIIRSYELFGNEPGGLYKLDSENAARTYTAPDMPM